jgi:hypothetical protein
VIGDSIDEVMAFVVISAGLWFWKKRINTESGRPGRISDITAASSFEKIEEILWGQIQLKSFWKRFKRFICEFERSQHHAQ